MQTSARICSTGHFGLERPNASYCSRWLRARLQRTSRSSAHYPSVEQLNHLFDSWNRCCDSCSMHGRLEKLRSVSANASLCCRSFRGSWTTSWMLERSASFESRCWGYHRSAYRPLRSQEDRLCRQCVGGPHCWSDGSKISQAHSDGVGRERACHRSYGCQSCHCGAAARFRSISA